MDFISVVGSLNIDVVVRASRMPEAGETLAGKEFHLIPGGKGANQAVAASKAGAPTRMVGCLGRDAFSPVLLGSLLSAGVDTSGILELERVATGTATILLDGLGENRIIIVPGANGLVTPTQIDQNWKSIQDSKMILLQMEIPMDTTVHAIRKASASGIPVILNAAPAYPLPDDLFRHINTLVANESEAQILTGQPVTEVTSATQAAKMLLEYGVRTCIITLGSQGAVLVSSAERLYQPSFKVDVLDTTAAGDIFVGVYAACILAGRGRAESLRFASAGAAIAVTRLGAQTSMPTWQEIAQFAEKPQK